MSSCDNDPTHQPYMPTAIITPLLAQSIHKFFELLQPADLVRPALHLHNGLHWIVVSRRSSHLFDHLASFLATPLFAPQVPLHEVDQVVRDLDSPCRQRGTDLADRHLA